MKKIYIIAGLLFLASCGQADVQEISSTTPVTETGVVEDESIENSEEPPVPSEDEDDKTKAEDLIMPEDEEAEVGETDTPAEEINDELATLDVAIEDSSKTATLDGAYTNPKGPVDMKITYSTDSEGLITALNVVATTYDLTDFNTEAQSLIGSTLEEAAEYKSGSSLTGYAFTQAVKSELN